MSGRGPDRDMEQPKAYKSSIDPKRVQPTMSMDTRQTQYKSAKPIDFNNKIPEYKPNNEYYKTSFWDAPRKKMVQEPKLKKGILKPTPAPKQPPPKRAPPAPKPKQNNNLKPLPQANFNSKRAPPAPLNPQQPSTFPETLSPQYPVRHFDNTEPEAWSDPSPETTRMEHWSEPSKVIPDLNTTKPAPATKEPDFTSSTVGSMSRMIAMFT